MKNIYDYIKRNVNLADFLQKEINCTLKWIEPNISASTVCPMPSHKEKQASFNIKFIEEDNTWIYNCFGCNMKGTIIDFFMQYYNLPDSKSAISEICKKFNFNDINDVTEIDLTASKKKASLRKKIEIANIVTSNQCRMLLRKSFEKNKKWVAESYKKINKALDNEELELVEKIGHEASKKAREE